MAPPTPLMTTLLNYVRDTVLPRVSAVALPNKYFNDLVTISKDYRDVRDMRADEFPAAFIVHSGFTRVTAKTGQEYTHGSNPQDTQDGSLVGIFCYVRVDEPGDNELTGLLSDELDKIYQDVLVAWHTDNDYRLGGTADAGSALFSFEKSQEFADKNIGEIVLWFSVKYDFNPSAGNA